MDIYIPISFMVEPPSPSARANVNLEPGSPGVDTRQRHHRNAKVHVFVLDLWHPIDLIGALPDPDVPSLVECCNTNSPTRALGWKTPSPPSQTQPTQKPSHLGTLRAHDTSFCDAR